MNLLQEASSVGCESVSKQVGGNLLLSNATLTLAAGDTLFLLGRQGSGKTVLLKILMGLMPPDRGIVWLNGQSIIGVDKAALLRARRSVGLLFQDAALFASLSVADNIAFPLRYGRVLPEAEIGLVVDGLLKELHLEEIAHKRPAELSRGVRKVAGLARALALGPRLLLMDDPWSDTDVASMHAMRSLLLARKQSHSLTCLITGNRFSDLLTSTDRVALLRDKQITQFGSLAEARDDESTQQHLDALEKGL